MLSVCATLLSLTMGCAPPTSLDSASAHDSVSVSLQERARSADSLINSIGLNVHLSYFRTAYGTGWDTIVKPKLVALGVRHLRDGGNVVPDDAWMRLVYGRMTELANAGIKFNLVMLPALGSTDYVHLNQFSRLMEYAAPVVESFEGLNEHDLSGHAAWGTETRTFQQALYARVKGDPRTASMPVYGPSMAHPRHAVAVGDLRAWMDFGAIHPYPGGTLPMHSIPDHATRTAVISGNRPFAATETGYHTALAWTGGHPGISEDAQARYTPRLLLEFFNTGISRTYLYEFIDQGSNSADRETSFGLLRADGSEKPAYSSLRNLITILRDPGPGFAPGELRYSLDGDSTRIQHTLVQKRDGRFYLILWQNAKSFDLQAKSNIRVTTRPYALTLRLPATQIRLFTPLTAAAATETVRGAGKIALEITDAPLIVEITP